MSSLKKLTIELTKCFLDSPAPEHVLGNYRVTLGNKTQEFYALTTKEKPKETRYYEYHTFAIVALSLARRGLDPFKVAYGGMTESELLQHMS